jgi:hypothetical protein
MQGLRGEGRGDRGAYRDRARSTSLLTALVVARFRIEKERDG